jgi:hypothetical protein
VTGTFCTLTPDAGAVVGTGNTEATLDAHELGRDDLICSDWTLAGDMGEPTQSVDRWPKPFAEHSASSGESSCALLAKARA